MLEFDLCLKCASCHFKQVDHGIVHWPVSDIEQLYDFNLKDEVNWITSLNMAQFIDLQFWHQALLI